MIVAKMAGTLKVTDKDALGIFISVDTERDTPLEIRYIAATNNDSSAFTIGLSNNVYY